MQTSPAEARGRRVERVMKWRFVLAAANDATLWAAGLTYATWARLEFDWSAVDQSGLTTAIFIAVVTQLAVGYAVGIYLGRWTATSFEGVGWLGISTAVTAVVLIVIVVLGAEASLVPRSAIVAGAAFQLVSALGVRYLVRMLIQAYHRSDHERSRRVIIFGAGEAGREIVRLLDEDRQTDLLPVAFIDDDLSKSRLRIRGVPVVGSRNDVALVAARLDASVLLIAVPSADHDMIAVVAEIGLQAGLEVRVVPRLGKYLADPLRATDIREIRLSDFLSRDEVLLDLNQIKKYLEGKRVLVTGAAGSIGSQLCLVINDFSPAQLIMLDISENGLHALSAQSLRRGAARCARTDTRRRVRPRVAASSIRGVRAAGGFLRRSSQARRVPREVPGGRDPDQYFRHIERPRGRS